MKLTIGRVRDIELKAQSKLRHSSRAVFCAFLPDEMLIDIFETSCILEIYRKFLCLKDYDSYKNELVEVLDERNKRIKTLIENQVSFNKNVNEKYSEFVQILKGSQLMCFLNEINKMSSVLNSQAVNIQSTLQIAQKYISQEIKLPQTQIYNFFDRLDLKIMELNELEERFRESINYKNS